MITTPKYVPPDIKEKILEVADLVEVVQDFLHVQTRGSSYVADCPLCAAKGKFNVTPAKKIFKCFSCDEGGNNAVTFLTRIQGMTFLEALAYLADRYGIDIEDRPTIAGNGRKKRSKSSFRDQQLKESGISNEAQRYQLQINENTTEERDRYLSGTINKYGDIDFNGDDMILVYIGIDGQPVQYKDSKGRSKDYFRVRYANPTLHLDKQGSPIRYRSPYRSGSHLWLPQFMIDACRKAVPLTTLYIIEGEKKADKLCMHGVPAVGVAGIHNFATDSDMPVVFEQIIQQCEVRNVVFLLDADWNEISDSPEKPVDQRPKTFFSAVKKFKDYFRAYETSGIFLQTYFGHGLDPELKGLDDVLVRKLKGKENELKQDLEKALVDRKREGSFVRLYDITSASDYTLREYWHLHAPKAFFKAHKTKLKQFQQFKYNRIEWRYDSESDAFEMAQKLMPYEQYWKEEDQTRYGKQRTITVFDYVNIRVFLRNRGFGIMEMEGENIRYIRTEGKIVDESSTRQIQKYVHEFTEEIERKDVLAMLLKGSTQYLGPDKLRHMYPVKPNFLDPDPDHQYLIFKSKFWKISADKITERPLSDLPYFIWQNRIIDFDANLREDAHMTIDKIGDAWDIKDTEANAQCEFHQFVGNTSMTFWRKLQEFDKDQRKYVQRQDPQPVTKQDLKALNGHIVSKMLAIGYVLHEFRDRSNMRAIICMDGLETEVGRSEGGTGKSLFATMFERIVPTYVIDAKVPKLTDDPHLYDGVDERTHVIVLDDCRVNIDFEFFFSQITRGLTVNPKGLKKFTIDPPKFVFATNHAIGGEGTSYRRRQYTISFSDYYNEFRTPKDDFGHMLFDQWDYRQWNLFYNYIAQCLQLYLRHGLELNTSETAITRRRMRQAIGEAFIDWAEIYFSDEGSEYRNHRISMEGALQNFLGLYPQQRKWTDRRRFKRKLQMYAEYAGLTFNPPDGKRIRSNSVEYFIIGDHRFSEHMADVKSLDE